MEELPPLDINLEIGQNSTDLKENEQVLTANKQLMVTVCNKMASAIPIK